MTTSPDSATYPSLGYGVLGPLVANWVNAQDFGADPTGNDPASEWIQAAASSIPDDGGVLIIPPGIYKTDRPVLLKSNTVVQANGATFRFVPYAEFTVNPDSGYNVFSHVNNAALTITDTNIQISGGVYDYTDFGSVPGGGAHALSFQYVSRIRISDITLQGGEDAVACRGCTDVVITNSSAYDFINCAWDFWWGCEDVRVIGCYSYSGDTVQHANFNCSGGLYTGQVGKRFLMQGCQLVHPSGGTRNYSSVFLDPLGTGNETQDMIIQGCVFRNVIIAARGNVRNALIQGCTFRDHIAPLSPILSYVDGGDTPDNIVVDNCRFYNPLSAAPNVAVIDVRGTNNRVTNNQIIGTAHSVAMYSFGGVSGTAMGNIDPNDNYGGTLTFAAGEIIKARNNKGWGLFDADDTLCRMYVQTDNNLRFHGTDATGDPRDIAYMQQRSDSSAWIWAVDMRTSFAALRTLGNTLTATGTVRTDALALTAQFNNVTTVAAGTGVRLPNRVLGEYIVRVRNGGANALNVYPYNGTDQINALGIGNPYSLAVGIVATFCLTDLGQWYLVGVSP